MRIFRYLIYLLIILILQTTIFRRLSIFGATPDLVLVSVIIFSIIYEGEKALYLSFMGGFLQDILSGGWYINALTKVLVCATAGIIKENFLGREESLIAGLVLIFTPPVLLFQAGISYFSLSFLFLVGVSTLYNLVLTPLLLPVIRRL